VFRTVSLPDVKKLVEKSLEEIRNLTFTKVRWSGISTLGFTLNDGTNCKVGTLPFFKSHTFDPDKKITRIESIIDNNENKIIHINFYHWTERLVAVGDSDYLHNLIVKGRIEVFEMAEDEKLIGCKLFVRKGKNEYAIFAEEPELLED